MLKVVEFASCLSTKQNSSRPSQASKLGLLSKLEAAGLTLKDVEKLLPLGECIRLPIYVTTSTLFTAVYALCAAKESV